MSDEALELLLSGLKDKDQQKAITNAYYSFGNGDPNSFPVRFAVILKAHAAGLKLVPTRLQRTLSGEIKPLRDALAAHQAVLEKAAILPPPQNGSGDILEEIRGIHADLLKQLSAHSELLTAERKAVVSNITITHSLLNRLAAHRIILGLVLSYLAGFLTYPLVQFVLDFALVRHK